MMKKTFKIIAVLLAVLMGVQSGFAQRAGRQQRKEESKPAVQAAPVRQNPNERQKAATLEDIDRIYNYLNGCTPFELVDADGNKVTDFSKIDHNTSLKKGDFGINTYEWGVTYSGMMLASQVTGDQKYAEYAYDRIKFLGQIFPYVKKYYDETGYQMKLQYMVEPRFIDDCGAMCAALIKASLADPKSKYEYRELLDHWFNFVMYKEYRMSDGILARHRPATNSVWLDDMYMGIPALAYYGVYANDNKYSREAAKQILLFKEKMWVPETQLFRHGWIEAMGYHPAFYWGRANGWAILTMCDVLDVLPENDPDRPAIIELLQQHIVSLAKLQSGDGFWHQLLDRNDSYMETSATAIYAYCIAHAINEGWIDGMAFGPVAQLAWEAVTTQINENGAVEGVCVGTGMAFDPAFYYFRNTSVNARHGYGPVLLAGGEMIRLIKNYYPRMNDAAILYYKQDPGVSGGIFSVK